MIITISGALLLAACGTAPRESVAPSSPAAESPSEPPAAAYPSGSLPAFLAEDGRFTTFLALLERDGLLLDWLLANPERSFTLFVPIDEAFDNLSPRAREAMAADASFVTGIVERHFLPHHLTADSFTSSYVFSGMSRRASRLALVVDGTRIWFGDARVIETDLVAAAGVVHVISGVNLGPTPDRRPIP